MKLATAAEMQRLDRTAIEEFNIPGIVLMENAGRGTVEFMVRELGPVRDRPVIIFAGPGNNGGDGLVIARHLHQRGGRPVIFFLVDPERLQGDAAANFRIVRRLRLPLHIIADAADLDAVAEKIAGIRAGAPVWSLVDAIFPETAAGWTFPGNGQPDRPAPQRVRLAGDRGRHPLGP
ncbi:MAG: hypothetical protein GXP57_05210 [Deltaproteobacteria bacterium]|nr:hypothetical protein [Deltaproteobacteria bacterium]